MRKNSRTCEKLKFISESREPSALPYKTSAPEPGRRCDRLFQRSLFNNNNKLVNPLGRLLLALAREYQGREIVAHPPGVAVFLRQFDPENFKSKKTKFPNYKAVQTIVETCSYLPKFPNSSGGQTADSSGADCGF
jgi:hypothetical protein